MRLDLEVPLKVVIAPRRYFGWLQGSVRRGGYIVAIEGCEPVAGETTLDAALDRLAELLEEWVDAEYHEDIGEWIEPDRGRRGLVVRQAVADGTLRKSLSQQAAQTKSEVESDEDPLCTIDEGPDGIPTPTMYGWLGDGEAQVEICESAPTAGWALAWLQHVIESPTDWRVVGRVWATYDPVDGGTWGECNRGFPGALEFWQLEKAIL